MPISKLFLSFLVGWPGLACAALTSRIAFLGPALSAAEYAGWFFLAGAPVAACLLILRGRSTRSIAHVLYDTELARDGRQKRSVSVVRG